MQALGNVNPNAHIYVDLFNEISALCQVLGQVVSSSYASVAIHIGLSYASHGNSVAQDTYLVH